MVDGINFNPFTGDKFTSLDIKELDTNNDGIVTMEELESNVSFISKYQQQDEEGEVAIEENNQSSALQDYGQGLKELTVGTSTGFWSGMIESFKGLAQTAKGNLQVAVAPFMGLYESAKNNIKGIGYLFTGKIGKGLKYMGKSMLSLVTAPMKWIGKGIKTVAKGIVNVTKGMCKGIGKAVKAVGKGIANIGKAIGKGIKKIFSGW